MILMEDGGLSCSPLSVSVREGWVSGQNSAQIPIEEIWHVDQSLRMHWLVVQYDGSRVSETSAIASHNEVDDPQVGDPASSVETFNG